MFDCNIYLDVARELGEPFSWDAFNKRVARLARESARDGALDSLRAVAMSTSGRFAGDATLEVWTNAHIDRIVRSKAIASVVPDPVTGEYGLGWSRDSALRLVDDLIHGLAAKSNGGTLGDTHMPDGNPPLDHEDGMVYGACRALSGDDPLASVYCVTRDRGFIEDYRAKKLSGHSRVVAPAQMVAAMKGARAMYSMRGMLPSG